MRKLLLLLALSVSLPLTQGSIAFADTDNGSAKDLASYSLEDLLTMNVRTASKKEEKVTETPAVVTVITAAEIKDFGATTLLDVLQRAPSIQAVGSHLYPDNVMAMRGDLVSHYDSHILVLINGRPFRDDITGGLNASIYQIFPVNIIDRIEIVRGPGSVLYGTDAFDGVINIITKRPTKNVEAEVTGGLGSFGADIARGTVGYKKGDLDFLVNVNSFKDDGWDFNATTFFPGTPNTTSSMKYYNHNISGSLFLHYKDFSFNFYNATLDQGNLGVNPAFQFGGGDNGSWLDSYRDFADLGYSKKFAGDYTLNLNVTYNYCTFMTYTKRSPSGEGAYDLLGEASFQGPIMQNMNFIVGGTATNMRRVLVESPKIPDFNFTNYSGYTQLDYTPVDKLKLVGGVQYNKIQDIDGVAVPRFAGVYQLSDKTGLKVSYDQAFRAPWPMETIVYFPGVIVGNPKLTPEKVQTTDAQFFYNTAKSQSALTVFDNNYNDLIMRVPHPTIPNTSSYANVGTMDIQGIELETKVSILPDLYVEGSGTYQSEKDDKVLTPNYMVKAGVSYHTRIGLNMSVFDNYFGAPKSNGGLVLNPAATAVSLVSVNLNYTIPSVKALEFNLFIQNALDQEYDYPEFSKDWINTLPLEPGRAIYGTVTYKY